MNLSDGNSTAANHRVNWLSCRGLTLCAAFAAASCGDAKLGSQDYVQSERNRLMSERQAAQEPEQVVPTPIPDPLPQPVEAPPEDDTDQVVLALTQSPLGSALSGCASPTRCANALSDSAGTLDARFTDGLGGFQCTWLLNSQDSEVRALFAQQPITALGQRSFVRPERVSQPTDCFTFSMQMTGLPKAIQDGSVTLTVIW